MQSTIRIVALLSFAAVATASAQGREAPRRGAGAQMLLAQTGELELTDAQVVRLAAIARRAETRRRSMRAAMDSARIRFGSGQPVDSAARRQFAQRMEADMRRAEAQLLADQRDAIAVLTPDQQAKAWNMVSNRGERVRSGRGMNDRMGQRGLRGRGPGMREPRPGVREPRFREPGQEPRMRRPMPRQRPSQI